MPCLLPLIWLLIHSFIPFLTSSLPSTYTNYCLQQHLDLVCLQKFRWKIWCEISQGFDYHGGWKWDSLKVTVMCSKNWPWPTREYFTTTYEKENMYGEFSSSQAAILGCPGALILYMQKHDKSRHLIKGKVCLQTKLILIECNQQPNNNRCWH